MKSGKLVLLLSVVAVATVAAHAFQPKNRHTNTSASAPNAPQAEESAEQANKNIQILKGLPNSQLLTVMHLMRTSLGVRCDYCHIAENGKYWMDDKPPKQVARRMIQMISEINNTNFDGQPAVTCNTGHRGQTKRVGRRREKLFFDTQSGLLVRRTALTATALGLDPEQTDFKDYTDVDGVKLPFTVIVSYLDYSHLGTTRKYIEVKHDVPIEDAKFEPPGK